MSVRHTLWRFPRTDVRPGSRFKIDEHTTLFHTRQYSGDLVVRRGKVDYFPASQTYIHLQQGIDEFARSLDVHHSRISLFPDIAPRSGNLVVSNKSYNFKCSRNGTNDYECLGDTVDWDICYGTSTLKFDNYYGTFDAYIAGRCDVSLTDPDFLDILFKHIDVSCSPQQTLEGSETYICHITATPSDPSRNLSTYCNCDYYDITFRSCSVDPDGTLHATVITSAEDPEDYIEFTLADHTFKEDDLRTYLAKELGVPRSEVVINDYEQSEESRYRYDVDADIYVASDEDISPANVSRAIQKLYEL